jgi:AcrR family transcriptional regulator
VPTRTSYHHGDLRAELLRATLELIEADGLGAVSLRKVAKAAGVSPGAPYHHFADRAALLSAVAAHGFVLLSERITAARAGVDGSAAAIRAVLLGYLGFAQEQPGYFGLMFRPELIQPDTHPDAHAAADAVFAQVCEVTDACVADGVIPAERADAFTLVCWSFGHGLAALTLDGQIGKHAAEAGIDPSTLIAGVVEEFTGLVRPPAGDAG